MMGGEDDGIRQGYTSSEDLQGRPVSPFLLVRIHGAFLILRLKA